MINVTDKTAFKKEVLDEKEKSVLVDFYADWCGPCKVLGPIVEKLAADNPQFKVVKVNVDQAQELAQQYSVMSIPTIYIFKQGKQVKQFVGVQSQKDLEAAMK